MRLNGWLTLQGVMEIIDTVLRAFLSVPAKIFEDWPEPGMQF